MKDWGLQGYGKYNRKYTASCKGGQAEKLALGARLTFRDERRDKPYLKQESNEHMYSVFRRAH